MLVICTQERRDLNMKSIKDNQKLQNPMEYALNKIACGNFTLWYGSHGPFIDKYLKMVILHSKPDLIGSQLNDYSRSECR